MQKKLKLPVGIEDFSDIRRDEYYYVDKTGWIEQLIEQGGKVSLFTRPRRFGKTLNMSMLRYFFQIGTDKALFDGLYISKCKDVCEKYMGKFPVIFISLKSVAGDTFEEALFSLMDAIKEECRRYGYILKDEQLGDDEKWLFSKLRSMEMKNTAAVKVELKFSIKRLSEILFRYFGKKAVILIDEYDVPLDRAFENGYYKKMVSLIRDLFGAAFKTNEYLEFAVLTGCLRVSKESIFTGLNNFKVLSITDVRFDEQFGFSEKEVENLLETYQLKAHMTEIKEWYDGYRFGEKDVYCPWDVINHVDILCRDPEAEPQAYWVNTSSNNLVKRFIYRADGTTRDEIELLIAGGVIEKELRLELTYDELDKSIDNLWSVLFTTGYLTLTERPVGGIYKLRIPNREVREIYRTKIGEWFREKIESDKHTLQPLWKAFFDGNAQKVEEILTECLNRTISVFDPEGLEKEKEKYYHAFLTGLLLGNGKWSVLSNKESGDGFPDILVKLNTVDMGLVIELKTCDKPTKLGEKCLEAMEQIRSRRYDAYLRSEGLDYIWAYGIAFYKKRCKVLMEKL